MVSPSGSSVTSFRTAQDGSPSGGAKDATANSLNSLNSVNGLQDAAKDNHNGPASPYRPVRDIPYQLRDHIRVYLEEKMYGEAIHLLTSLLAAGGSDGLHIPSAITVSASAPTTGDTPVWLPPASHLSVLASLAVHPAYTTRPQDGTDMRVAGHAMQYLRHVLTVAGPVGAEMASAFEFRDVRGRRTSVARAAAARARGGAATGRGRDTNAPNNKGTNTNGASSANRPRRQLRAASGRTSLGTGDYVDSRTMSWSDDEFDGGGKQKKPKKKGRAGREDVSMVDRDPARDRARGRDNAFADGDDDADDDDDNDFADEDNDDDAVSSRMATRDGVWMRGQSFWRVAGWALTCSVREPERWQCWQPWLTLMVDVLEADLVERLHDIESGDDADGDLYDSLLFQYLSDDSASGGSGSSSTTHLRHLASVILADGSQPALAQEIFDKETLLAADSATVGMARPTRVLDLDNDKFGDYSDDDESAPSTPESSPSPSPSPSPFEKKAKSAKNASAKKKSSSSTSSLTKMAQTSDSPGFLESLPLRRRLFYLVGLGTIYFPTAFATSDDLYRAFAQVLRETDISIFAAFVAAPPPTTPSPTASSLTTTLVSPENIFVGLLRHILFTYLPTSAPKPHIVEPESSVTTLPTSRLLERCFLPFAANTVLLGANVRMSLALESLFRTTWQPTAASTPETNNDEQLWSPALQRAAELGVQAREARAKSSSSKVEAYGRDLLKRSGCRLLAMVQLARMDAGEPEMISSDL